MKSRWTRSLAAAVVVAAALLMEGPARADFGIPSRLTLIGFASVTEDDKQVAGGEVRAAGTIMGIGGSVDLEYRSPRFEDPEAGEVRRDAGGLGIAIRLAPLDWLGTGPRFPLHVYGEAGGSAGLLLAPARGYSASFLAAGAELWLSLPSWKTWPLVSVRYVYGRSQLAPLEENMLLFGIGIATSADIEN